MFYVLNFYKYYTTQTLINIWKKFSPIETGTPFFSIERGRGLRITSFLEGKEAIASFFLLSLQYEHRTPHT